MNRRCFTSWMRVAAVATLAFTAISCGGEPEDMEVGAATQAVAFHKTYPNNIRFYEKQVVNVVLFGFEGKVDKAKLASLLPPGNYPWQTFQYNVLYAPSWFDDWLFGGYLSSIATPQPLIEYMYGQASPISQPISYGQWAYNNCNLIPSVQAMGYTCINNPPAWARVNQRMVTQNYLINAADVEKTLAWVLPAVWQGLDVTRPTVVLMNWHGRADYKDHVYIDPSEPDPETGYPRGLDTTNFLAGSGGTPEDDPETCADGQCQRHRIWFHDLSAGPFFVAGNSDITGKDARWGRANMNGVMDYRIHHMADYANTTGLTYRSMNTLEEDLADKLVGEIFLGLIANQHPIYDPMLTWPSHPKDIQLDINRWEWDPNTSFAGMLSPAKLASAMSKLPTYNFTVEVNDQKESRGQSKLGQVYSCFTTSSPNPNVYPGQSCYGNKVGGMAGADLFVYFDGHKNQYFEGDADHEIGVYQFNVAENDMVPYVGWAVQDWYAQGPYYNPVNGRKQGPVTTFTPPYRNAYQGHTGLIAHEVGHHLGLRHPFAGTIAKHTPSGLAWKQITKSDGTHYSIMGMHVSGVMTYQRTNTDFSRFERDNMGRWLMNVYYSLAVNIDEQMQAKAPNKYPSVAPQVQTAVAYLNQSYGNFLNREYELAAEYMRKSYELLAAAAGSINVKLEPNGRPAQNNDFINNGNEWKAYTKDDSPGDKLKDMSPRLSDLAPAGMTFKTDRVVFKNLKLKSSVKTTLTTP